MGLRVLIKKVSVLGWKSRLVTKGSGLEFDVWKILGEMGLRYASNVWFDPVFRTGFEADIIVEKVLVVECHSTYFHTKKRRMRKDRSKRFALEMMGYGVLELWDFEIKWACQVKRGKVWRPYIKGLISKMLKFSRDRMFRFKKYYGLVLNSSMFLPLVAHPDFPNVPVRIDKRNL